MSLKESIAKAQLLLLQIQASGGNGNGDIKAEGWDKDPTWINRGKDGRFGGGQSIVEKSSNPQDVLSQVNNFLKDSKQFETTKNNTYQTLGIKNPDILGSSFMTGYGSPDIIQELVFGGLRQVAGLSAEQAKKIVEDIAKNPEASVKEALSKYEGLATSPPAQLSTKMIETYLDHKKNLSNCIGYSSEITEKDFATQIGCFNSFAIETVVKAAPYLGVAILPELTGSAVARGTLEAMATRVAQEIPKKVVVGSMLNEGIKRSQEEKMGRKATALTAGLLVGGALKEAQNAAESNPEAYAKIQNTIADINPSIDKINNLANAVNTAIQDIDPQDIEKALDDLPDKYQKTLQSLTGAN